MRGEVFFVVKKLGGDGWGGAHKVLSILANYLAGKEYRVSIIVGSDSEIYYHVDERIKIKKLHCNAERITGIALALFKTRRILSKHRPSYLYAFMAQMAIYSLICSVGLGINVIAAERTDPRSEPRKRLARCLRNIAFCFMYKNVFQTADAMSYFPTMAQRKSYIIPNPIGRSLPNPYIGLREKEFVAFCRIDRQKNLPMMIDAFCLVHDKYPEYVLKIYGKGLIEEEIKEYIFKKEAERFIELKGFEKEIHLKIINASGFLSSSDYEGISNSMLEAMAIGLPCICTDCPAGGARTYIRDSINGVLVPVGNCKAMCNAIIRIIEEPQFAEKIGRNASYIRKELDSEKICSKWEQLMD